MLSALIGGRWRGKIILLTQTVTTMTTLSFSTTVGVVGAGTMGAGIAQVAAAAGHQVLLYDALEGAAEKGRARVEAGLEERVARGKISAEDKAALMRRMEIIQDIKAFAPAGLVVEAVVEDLEIKQKLFAELEDIVARDAILATNTSSISVTSIAAKLKHPGRCAGLHFFNPAPAMKLVEIVSGLATDADVSTALFDSARNWGKLPVHAKSTPGFIVNRVARPFYAEALRLLEEQVADAATIDAVMTEGAGFRMGPFALMDLIGNDVNYTVSTSVFEAYYHDPRFRPSLIQKELVSAGWLGRKSGRGYFVYTDGVGVSAVANVQPRGTPIVDLVTDAESEFDGIIFAPTDGRTADQRAQEAGKPVVLFDLRLTPERKGRVAFAVSSNVPADLPGRIAATFSDHGVYSTQIPDWPGLIAARSVAMLANEGFEAVMHGVGTEDGIDMAMRFGLNFPEGPINWARNIGLTRVLGILDAIHQATGDPRYRASYALRRAGAMQGMGDGGSSH